ADEAVPALANGRFDGDLDRRLADDAGLVVLALRLEQLEAWHRDDARGVPGLVDDALGGDRDLDFRARSKNGNVGVAVGAGQLVGAAAARVLLEKFATERGEVLPGEGEHARTMPRVERELPALGGLGRV